MADGDPVVVTAAYVGGLIAQISEVGSGIDSILLNCAALSPETKAQWTQFVTSWNAFVDSVNDDNWQITPFASVTLELPFVTLAQVRAFQAQFAQWEDIAKAQCGASGAVVGPPPDETPWWWTALKWGAVGLAGGAVLFAVAPAIEAAAATKAAGFVAGRVRKSAAATKALYQRARKNPVVDRAAVAVKANDAGRLSRQRGAPRLTADSPRHTLLRWLEWNDPNGSYSDEAGAIEGAPPLTVDAAWELIADQLSDY
jgi:hypothetical protein